MRRLAAILTALLLCTAALAQESPLRAIRSLPSSIKPGDTFAVTVSFSGDHRGEVTLREWPPAGWEVIAVSPVANPFEAPLEWTGEIGHVGSPWHVTYMLRAPSDASGFALFRGEVAIAGAAAPIAVNGASGIEIGTSFNVWGFEINAWELLGIFATLFFASRFMIQWIASERSKRSVVPTAFWWISLIGSALLLLYGIHFRRLAVVLGQAFGFIVYIRNLILIRNHSKSATLGEATVEPNR